MVHFDDEPISRGQATWNPTDDSPGGNVFSQDDKKKLTGGSEPPGGGGGDKPTQPDKKDATRGKNPSFKEPPDGGCDDPDDNDPDDEDWGDY